MTKIVIKTNRPIKKGKYLAKPTKRPAKKYKIGKDFQLV